MFFGVIADVHGNFTAMRLAMQRHPDVPFWLCVGDLASRAGEYPESPAPLYWIKGNNEDFTSITAFASGDADGGNLHYIANGTVVHIGALTVAGLGGTFAPTWYETGAAALPFPGYPPGATGKLRVKDDKRRHFVLEEVEACKRLKGVDVFLTHEAPRPFVLPAGEDGARSARYDVGKRPINEVLAAMRPRLHLCGHHHRFAESVREGVPSVCVDRISRSYLLVDAATLAYRKLDQEQVA
jgi:Calcineurin-like phosphoesterase superfamily domain